MARKPTHNIEPKLTEHGVSMTVNMLKDVRSFLVEKGLRDNPFTQRIDEAIEHLQTGN